MLRLSRIATVHALSATAFCRSLFAVQNRKLAEYLAGLNHRQQQLFASRGRHADTDGSAEQSHHLVAGRADGENRFARVERAHTRKRNDLGPLVGTQAAKQTAIQEKVTGFLERPFVRTHGVVSPRGVSELIDARPSRDHDVTRTDGAVNEKRSRLVQILRSYDSHIVFIYGASASLPPLWARRPEISQFAFQILRAAGKEFFQGVK